MFVDWVHENFPVLGLYYVIKEMVHPADDMVKGCELNNEVQRRDYRDRKLISRAHAQRS